MNAAMKIFDLFRKTANNADTVNESPNAWGRQQWENKEYDRTKAAMSNLQRGQKTFVQKFVEENITGVRYNKDGSQL